MTNIVAFIPCRSLSKGVKHKNIRNLGGLPLIAWSIKFAQESGLRVIVDSDSPQYLDIADKYGVETLLRPLDLASDTTSMFEVLQNEIPRISPKPDIIILLQPTTPFRNKESILKSIEMMKDFDSVISVQKVESPHPDEMLIETKEGLKMFSGVEVKDRITRRQDHRKAYLPTGSFYVLRTINLSRGNLYGDRVGIVVENEMININSEEDFKKCEEMLKVL